MINMDSCRKALDSMAGLPVMIIGDIMLDHYVFGTVERISPEAPVPVVRVDRERYLLGGAGNVALNIAALGGKPVLFGLVGADGEGQTIRTMCAESGFEIHAQCDGNRQTTRKTRIVAGTQQVVRVDRESAIGVGGEVLERLIRAVRDRLDGIKVIILSDYGKGLISQEFMDMLMDMLKGLDERPLVLVDPKTPHWGRYGGVDMLTPNTKEASEGSGVSIENTQQVIEAGAALFKRLNCRNLLITMGAQGMAVFEQADKVYHIPTVAKKVFDVTGAGDTVIATLGLGLAAGADLLTAAVLANYAAGITVGQVGAATATRQEVGEALLAPPKPEITRLT